MLIEDADLLIHDSQYTSAEYAVRVGWGTVVTKTRRAWRGWHVCGRLVTFHHEPTHSDDVIDALHAEYEGRNPFELIRGQKGARFEV